MIDYFTKRRKFQRERERDLLIEVVSDFKEVSFIMF